MSLLDHIHYQARFRALEKDIATLYTKLEEIVKKTDSFLMSPQGTAVLDAVNAMLQSQVLDKKDK